MEWTPEVRELYEKVTAKIPEVFRSAVKPLLWETAEKKCLIRNGSFVSEADLITSLFEITPASFRATAADDVKSLGIDGQRYIELVGIQNEYKRSWDQIGAAFLPGNYHFTMYLTDRCNQRCIHCAADLANQGARPELSTEEWIQIIENVEGSLRKRGRRGVYIWFGGDPTMRSDLRQLIKYCGDHGYYNAISTNGILFDDDMAKFCAENKMSHVFISFDSVSPEKAARIRGVPKAYELAEKAIKASVKYGHFTLCTTTAMKQNIDELDKIKALIESWGAMPYFRAVIRQRNAAVNWNEIGLSSEDYRRFYDFKFKLVVDAVRKGEASKLQRFSTYDMVPFMETPRNDREHTFLDWGVGCQACRTISGIDVNGDVFPCDYPSDLKLGNLLKQSFEEIMDSQLFKDIRDKKRTGRCASCEHIDLCGGGCRVHAECETGDFFESFSYCWHENEKTIQH
jgi:radical SAM protein with 4Fe4S-binding SPASM domain